MFQKIQYERYWGRKERRMKEYIVKDMTGEFEDKDYPELIRCKDCVKYKIFGDGYCPWIEQEVEEDFFCADGKREEQ